MFGQLFTQEESRPADSKLAVHDATVRHVQNKQRLGCKDARIKRDRLLGAGYAEIGDKFACCHGSFTCVGYRFIRLVVEQLAERGDYRGIVATCKESGVTGEKLADF